jgi:hypothetical protein
MADMVRFRLFWGCVAGAALLAGLGGCAAGASGDFVALVPIVGGEKIRVPFKPAPLAKNAEMELLLATFDVQREAQTLTYRFELKLLHPLALKSVTVENVAGDEAVLLVKDESPVLNEQRWRGASAPVRQGDSRIAWLQTVENSILVYRFTLETAEGRRIVLLQPSPMPALLKPPLRQALGYNY